MDFYRSCLGEYIPQAPVNDEAKQHNQNLPGLGGVFNTVNLNLYHYAANNPVKYTDPDGNNIAFGVDKNGAGGNGHTSLYFQDAEGNWYKFDQGATEGPSGTNIISQYASYASSNFEAGVSIQKIEKLPDGLKEIKTTKSQDEKICQSVVDSYNQHNNGKKKYHILSNNCTDAAVDVVNKAKVGFKVKNPWNVARPNEWIKVYNEWYKDNNDMTSKDKTFNDNN